MSTALRVSDCTRRLEHAGGIHIHSLWLYVITSKSYGLETATATAAYSWAVTGHSWREYYARVTNRGTSALRLHANEAQGLFYRTSKFEQSASTFEAHKREIYEPNVSLKITLPVSANPSCIPRVSRYFTVQKTPNPYPYPRHTDPYNRGLAHTRAKH